MTDNKNMTQHFGEAGKQGDRVRSDLYVRIERERCHGIVVDCESKVEAFYGNTFREQVNSVLTSLGVNNARVEIQDQGALPFVIAARLEAAFRNAFGKHSIDVRPECTVDLGAPSKQNRLRRSRLYIPGNEPKFMINAGLYEADAIILDLEDSVHPNAKLAARVLVRNALRCVDFGSAERMVRINQLPLGKQDLEEIVLEEPDVILVPKTETPEQVEEVDQIIAQQKKNMQSERPTWIMPILESALGIENAFHIAKASSKVVALTLGLEDYTADLGVQKTALGDETLWARSRVVNAACAAGVQAIDSVYGDVGNEEGLQAWAKRARSMGFVGMGCVHPRQIPVIHQAFSPSHEEIKKAMAVVKAFMEAESKGLAVVSLGSKMIDPPVVERAKYLVEQAKAMGIAEED